MQLVSYERGGRPGFGLLAGGAITPLAERMGRPSLRALLAADPDLRSVPAGVSPEIALSEVTLAPVLPDATRIFCIGTNYSDHVAETRSAGIDRKQTGYPMVFLRLGETLVAHGAALQLPAVSDALDFEGELAVIIGQGGRYIPRAEALSHVAGYACFNDASVRDWQFHAGQVTPGKNFPGTAAFGPVMVTADEVPDPQALSLETRVNGTVVQQASTAQMIFDVAFLVSYLSFFQPLQPGDVIASGTPSGVGFARKPPLFLAEGDRCEVAISGVGHLSNPVARAAVPEGADLTIPVLDA